MGQSYQGSDARRCCETQICATLYDTAIPYFLYWPIESETELEAVWNDVIVDQYKTVKNWKYMTGTLLITGIFHCRINAFYIKKQKRRDWRIPFHIHYNNCPWYCYTQAIYSSGFGDLQTSHGSGSQRESAGASGSQREPAGARSKSSHMGSFHPEPSYIKGVF